MATAQQILGLLRSHAKGDEERFHALSMQIAAAEERKGHRKLADEIRKLADTVAQRKKAPDQGHRAGEPVPIVAPRGELAGIMSASYPKTRLRHMVLPESVSRELAKVVTEHRQRWKLSEHGLWPRAKVLLVGPPGSGKTMTASALAGELALPLFTILLHGLITKYMGETAAKLRIVFDAIADTRGLYLFDELDAIGAKRATGNDVGEARRILNSFLQFLEEDRSESLIVATTNHPEILDRALFRRFHVILEYALPERDLIVQTVESRLAMFPLKSIDWDRVAGAAEGLSNAEIIRAAEDAARDAVLSGQGDVETDALSDALAARMSAYRPT